MRILSGRTDGLVSKREDRIREASSLHAKIGQLQRYCELMVELGEVRSTTSKIISLADRNEHIKTWRGVAWCLGCWICNPEVPGSNPPHDHQMDLRLVVPDSTPPRFVNSFVNSFCSIHSIVCFCPCPQLVQKYY